MQLTEWPPRRPGPGPASHAGRRASGGPAESRPAGSGRSARAGRRASAALAVLAALALLAAPGRATYDDNSLRAILFNAERARETGAPLVLLAHETVCDFIAYGPRTFDEHWIWYVGDPASEVANRLRQPEFILEVRYEQLQLDRCRIFRGGDTLWVEPAAFTLESVPAWPMAAGFYYRAVRGKLPELRAGDIVEIAYRISNRWSSRRAPSAWGVIPIRHPWGPTIERHILVTHNPVLKGRVKVLGDEHPPVRHFGVSPPKLELLTGDLPAGSGSGTRPGEARMLFTASLVWREVAHLLGIHYGPAIEAARDVLAGAGDSLSDRHAPSRERLEAVLAYVDRHWARLPLELCETSYFPGDAQELNAQRAAGPLDRAILAAGLARAAHLQVALLLARTDEEPFAADFQVPHQFDRLALRVELLEEGRAILVDPLAPDLETAIANASACTLFLGCIAPWEGLHERDDDGSLRRSAIE